MILKKLFYFTTTAMFALIMVSCGKSKREFTRQAWSFGDGLVYPNRDAILDDLLTKHKVEGLNHYEVIQLLGSPQDKDTVKFKYAYQIVNNASEYNPKKNPVYKKDLVIYFSKDSIVTKTDVVEKNKEWK